ncbi:hypothetical protein PWT90_08382 [Aphanocladium album]|nr:hypothetical protein PWT90_08382 [Aphanocladium album]
MKVKPRHREPSARWPPVSPEPLPTTEQSTAEQSAIKQSTISQVAEKFGVTSQEARSKLRDVAPSAWVVLARVQNPPPWKLFIQNLNDRVSSKTFQSNHGKSSRKEAPTVREVRAALDDAIQEATQGQSSTVSSPAQASAHDDLRQPDGDQPNEEESHPGAQRAPTVQAENDIPFDAEAVVDPSSPPLVLRLILGHVEEANRRLDETKVPAVARAETLEKIDGQILDCFQRLLDCPQPTDARKSTQDDIVRYAGERKLVEIYGLRDAEITYEKQTASVLQKLSVQLITALGPAVLEQSLQTISPQTLRYIPDNLFNRAPLQITHKRRHQEGSSAQQEREKRRRTAVDNPASTESARVTSENACEGVPDRETTPDLNIHVAEEFTTRQPEHTMQQEETPARQGPPRHSAEQGQTEARDPANDEQDAISTASEGPLEEENIISESGDGDDNGSDVSYNEWMIHQVKTRLFTSADSVKQCWIWLEQHRVLRFIALKNPETAEWGVLLNDIDFNIRLKEVAEVRGSVKSLRVQLVMEKNCADLSDGAPRGDVMVVFMTEKITRQFLAFCRDQGVTVVEQEPLTAVQATDGRLMEKHEVRGAFA